MNAAFLDYWEGIRRRLEKEFGQWVPELFGDLPDPQVQSVHRSLEAGKRIRGCLVCLVCEALGGTIQSAISRAVGIECIQAASLIHDDYVDGDRVRRNQPAEWTLQGSRQAVLLGDVMFATVIRNMMEMGVAEGSVVANVIATMAKGAYQEHVDRSNLGHSVSEGTYRSETYERIIHLKTGALFGAAAQLGAIAAGASASVRTQAFTFGCRLGEAYQIADDLAEVVKLEQLPEARRAELSAVAPILFRFSRMSPVDLLSVLNENRREQSKWVDEELPLIKDRMLGEISTRSQSAISELIDFPGNRHTRLLHNMPAQVIRSMETTAAPASSHPE